MPDPDPSRQWLAVPISLARRARILALAGMTPLAAAGKRAALIVARGCLTPAQARTRKANHEEA
jgi:hypothetical protein